MNKVVKWTIKAKSSLDQFCQIIAEESPQSAKKVKKEIVLASKKLAINPYMYQIDEYYPDNQGNIRRYFRWNYKIVYQVKEKIVIVLEVYHTSTSPDQKTESIEE